MPPPSNGIQTNQRLALGVAALVFLLALAPYLAFVASGFSPFETFWEFSCYRYFEAVSFFERTTAPFWVGQGMPMALLQTGLMRLFLLFDLNY